MAELDYDELQRLADAATPGPWQLGSQTHGPSAIVRDAEGLGTIQDVWVCDADAGALENAEFIVASRTALPALLDRVRELEGEREMVDAWLHVADHDALKPCYSADPKVTFLDHVLDRLTQLADLEATVNELAPVPAFDVRELEAERDAALSTIAKVEALHQRVPARYFGTDLNPSRQYDCRCCGEGRAWPCPTIRALGSVPSTGEGNE